MRVLEASRRLRPRLYMLTVALGLGLGALAALSPGGDTSAAAVGQPAVIQPTTEAAQQGFADLGIVRLSPWNGDPEMAVGIPFDGDDEMPIERGEEAAPPVPAAVQVRAEQR